MRFCYLSRINNLEDGGLRFAEVYVNEESQLVADYQTRPFTEGLELSDNAYQSILSKEVKSVSFSYVSVAENEQSSENLEWLDDWEEDRLDIPLAVRITVTWKNEDTENFSGVLRVTVTMNATEPGVTGRKLIDEEKDRGIALITVLLSLAIISVIVTSVSISGNITYRLGLINVKSMSNMYVAESRMSRAVWDMVYELKRPNSGVEN